MPKKPKRPRRPRHDASYKSIFAQRRAVADTLRGVVRDLVQYLDLSTLERLPASFVTEHLGQRHADMLWRIRASDETWLYLLVLLEFQSTVDRRMALRMMDYTVRVLKALGKDDLGARSEYPPVLPIVIYNGERRWNAATDVRQVFAPLPEEFLGYLPRHPYLLIELQALDPSLLPRENVLSMIARFEQARSPEQLEKLVVSLAQWIEQAGEPDLVDSFRAWITLVLAQRIGRTGRTLELDVRKEEEAKMTTLIERARKWGQERDQQWLEKGIEKGIQRGRREGLQQGRAEGERELVYRLVTRRFGAGVAEQLIIILDSVSDLERIAAVADAVLECDTAEDFLARATEVAAT